MMVETTLQSRPGFPIVGVIFAAAGALGVAFGLAGGMEMIELSLLAAPFLLVGMALLGYRPRPFVAHVAPDALEVMDPPLTLPYADIEWIRGKGRSSDLSKGGRQHYAIAICHPQGVLRVPANLNVFSEELLRFLIARIPTCGSRDVNQLLHRYLDGAEEKFGPDKVFSWRARKVRNVRFDYRWVWIWLALIVSGVLWVVGGSMMLDQRHRGGEPWLVFGVLLGLVSLFGLMINLAGVTPNRDHRKWKNEDRRPGLVVSPLGLALIQNDLKGEMAWEELKKVKFQPTPKGFAISSADQKHGIILDVEGAQIHIADIYDRPLWLIYRQIMKYWKGKDV